MANTVEIVILVTNKGSKGIDSAEKSLSGLSGVANVATGIFGALTTGIGLATGAIVAFGASAVKEGAAYTKAMSNVKAITGATEVEFEALSAAAEELGRTTKFTATEAAEGMSFLAMAGFEVNEVIGAMPGVLNLAAAGNLALGQSADIVSNVLTGFGADASETGRFVDVLTKTFTSSNTSLQQLGQGMKFVAPVAADLGLSVEQAAAAMGVLGDGGIQASMAGTTLRTALLNLAAPVGKGKALLEELGIEVTDAQGAMLPFPKIIGNFNKGMEGMSEAQRTATLRTIIGKRAISGFSLLLKKGEKGLSDFGQELLDSGGTAAEIAATQLDNLSGDVTIFKSALSGIKIDVFKALEPVLRGIVAQGKLLLERFGPQLTAAFKGAISSISNFINKIIGIFQKFGIRGVAISILGQLGLTPDQIALAFGVVDQITEIVNRIVGAFERFGIRGATVSILGMLGLEPAQIADILSVVDGFIESTTEAFGKISGAFQRFGARGAAISIMGILGLEPETISLILSTIDTIAKAITDFISGLTFNEIIGAITGIGIALVAIGIPAIIATIVAALGTLLSPILLIVAGAALLGAAWAGNWFGIQDVVFQAITAITDLFNTAFPIIQAVVLTAGAVISGIFAGVMSVVVGQVVPNLQAAFANITTALSSLGINWGDVWNAVLSALGIVAAAIGAILLALVATIVGIIAGISAAILVVTTTFQAMLGSVEQIITGVVQLFVGFVEFWKAIFAGDLTGAVEAWKLQMAGLGNFIGGIFELVLTAITTPLMAAIAFFSEFGTSIISFFTELSNTLVGNSIIPDMVMAIIETFTLMTEPILAVFSTLSEGIATVLGAIFGGGGEEAAAPTIDFDPAEMLAGMELVDASIAAINLGLNNITIITLPALIEAFTLVTTLMTEQLLLLLNTGILPVDMALIQIYTVTLPTLQAVTIATAAAMVAALMTVQSIIIILTGLINALGAAIEEMAKRAESAAKKIAKGMKTATERIAELVKLVIEATAAFEEMAKSANKAGRSARNAGSASRSKTGVGFAHGLGFQAGTPSNVPSGLGFKIPPGFPNDSFGPMFAQSGEEMLITPKGLSIADLISSRLPNMSMPRASNNVTNITNNFEQTINTRTSQSPGEMKGNFRIMQLMLG